MAAKKRTGKRVSGDPRKNAKDLSYKSNSVNKNKNEDVWVVTEDKNNLKKEIVKFLKSCRGISKKEVEYNIESVERYHYEPGETTCFPLSNGKVVSVESFPCSVALPIEGHNALKIFDDVIDREIGVVFSKSSWIIQYKSLEELCA